MCAENVSKKSCAIVPNPKHHIAFGPKAPVCGAPLNATVCDPKQRTVNTGAKCGAPDDYFYYSPWRRPGCSSTPAAARSAIAHRWHRHRPALLFAESFLIADNRAAAAHNRARAARAIEMAYEHKRMAGVPSSLRLGQ